jgi:hypothetical protein
MSAIRLALTAAIGICAFASGCYAHGRARSSGYVVYHAPPPPPAAVVVAPPAPYAGAVWVDGHWSWDGYQYVWVEGYYVEPRVGYVYVQPRWVRRGGGWVYMRGSWSAGGHGHARVHVSRPRGPSVYVRQPRARGHVRVRVR